METKHRPRDFYIPGRNKAALQNIQNIEIVLISHTSRIMLKIFQSRYQHYIQQMNRRNRDPQDRIGNIQKKREF